MFALVEQWSDTMLRLALAYLRERALAEEVVQETWIAVLEGIDRFEGRSSGSTDPDWFLPADDPWAGHWAASPRHLPPEEQLLAKETRQLLVMAIRRLPASQRAVVTLRDVDGWSAKEVCSVLQLSEANQRVLLHPTRSSSPGARQRTHASRPRHRGGRARRTGRRAAPRRDRRLRRRRQRRHPRSRRLRLRARAAEPDPR